MHQSSLVHKQAMDLLAHFSNPLTKPSMVAARLLPYHLAWKKSLNNASVVCGVLWGTEQQVGRGTTGPLPMDL